MIDQCYVGDVCDGLRAFVAAGIRAQTCVTSPPYWGLRDYGTGQWEGGDAAHQHDTVIARSGRGGSGSPGKQTDNAFPSALAAPVCACGARRIDRQIGLEPTNAEYVATMVEVFRLVRDVLADDGTLWLNLGDSYATGAGKVGERPGGGVQGDNWQGLMTSPNRLPQAGLKPKDLCGIPWRVAFALQADGWYLRSDIIWSKPNPMPESVTDRPTKSHEYLFLLAKSERYYYDAAAIAEPSSGLNGGGFSKSYAEAQPGHGAMRLDRPADLGTRNRRSVWTVATAHYSDAHFATFPPALLEPCVLAGTSAHGHCPQCGKGWERIASRDEQPRAYADVKYNRDDPRFATKRNMGARYQAQLDANPKLTRGWRPACGCGSNPIPGVVLDPFMGSGTVAKVAQSLGRRWIGCELNPAYVAMQQTRAAQLGMAL